MFLLSPFPNIAGLRFSSARFAPWKLTFESVLLSGQSSRSDDLHEDLRLNHHENGLKTARDLFNHFPFGSRFPCNPQSPLLGCRRMPRNILHQSIVGRHGDGFLVRGSGNNHSKRTLKVLPVISRISFQNFLYRQLIC